MGRAWLFLFLIVAVAVAAAAQKNKNEGQQPRTLTGHVYDSEKQPVAKAIVYLKNTKTLAMKTYITETDGSYRFPALSTAVDYEVYAEYRGARSDTKTLSEFDGRKEPVIALHIKSKQ